MWRGSFEGEDSGDGRKVYRLKWLPQDHEFGALTDEQKQSGLFIRYLIGLGKISETMS